jgi:DNA excision repair protein ERCC-2
LRAVKGSSPQKSPGWYHAAATVPRRIDIAGLQVVFPFDQCYREQQEYMTELKLALDAKGHCVLEMPTGTGKTVALLALILAYQWANKDAGKLIYCTRTVPEMEQVLEELRGVVKARVEVLGEGADNIIGVGLSARRNMCTHPQVSKEPTREAVDKKCRELTAPWVREVEGSELCAAHEAWQDGITDRQIPAGWVTTGAARYRAEIWTRGAPAVAASN